MPAELAHQKADKHLCVALHRKVRIRLHPFKEPVAALETENYAEITPILQKNIEVGHIMSAPPHIFAPQKLKILADYDVRYCNQRYSLPPHGYCYSHGICWCPQNLFLYSIALGCMCHHVDSPH